MTDEINSDVKVDVAVIKNDVKHVLQMMQDLHAKAEARDGRIRSLEGSRNRARGVVGIFGAALTWIGWDSLAKLFN